MALVSQATSRASMRCAVKSYTPRARFSTGAPNPPAPPKANAELTEKIAKRLSRSGFCSRRVGEELVLQGKVTVDNVVVQNPATRVRPSQKVAVDGVEKKVGPMRLWVHNKKAGVTVTERDSHAEIPLIPHLQSLGLPRLQPIGRLDINSEGLLLLTNNGELKQALERSDLKRKYRVRVRGDVPNDMVEKLKEGITIDGVHYAPVEMSPPMFTDVTRNQWLTLTLQEGKNREIRKIMRAFGLQTSRLIRTQFGPYMIDNLEAGATHEVEIKSSVRRWIKRLREGKLDMRSLNSLKGDGDEKEEGEEEEGE